MVVMEINSFKKLDQNALKIKNMHSNLKKRTDKAGKNKSVEA